MAVCYYKIVDGVLYIRNNSASGYSRTEGTPAWAGNMSITSVNIETQLRLDSYYQFFYNLKNCTVINGIEKIDVSLASDCWDMFAMCHALTSLDVSNFDTSNVTEMTQMFSGCSSLSSLDVSNFNTSKVTKMNNMFNGCNSLSSLDVSNFDTSNVTRMDYMFNGCESLVSLDLSNFNTSKVTHMDCMFQRCESLALLNVSNFNTSKVTKMNNMFNGCNSLSSLDVSNFDTSNVTTMNDMFRACESLVSLDVSNFNTSNVTRMDYMFRYCVALTSLDLSNFNTSNVTRMDRMFNVCNALTSLDISNFNTSDVTRMDYMFNGCSALTSLDVSNFDTSNVTTMNDMFDGCNSLSSLDVTNFNTSNVTRMDYMFRYCAALTSLDLSNFNTSDVTTMRGMFSGCVNLTSIDLSNFDMSNTTDIEFMFEDCESLRGNINVNGAATGISTGIFSGTTNDIYIINTTGSSGAETTWKAIVSDYSNVHYEADDNQTPALSMSVTRVGEPTQIQSPSGDPHDQGYYEKQNDSYFITDDTYVAQGKTYYTLSETPLENGEFALINATAIVYNNYIPNGWSIAYSNDETLTKDTVIQSNVYWDRTVNSNVYILKCLLTLNDTSKHVFTLQTSGLIKDENDILKVTNLSPTITQILSKAYKLVDYYHDPVTDTEGMSIGKFATDANLFDVEMPTLFRDTVSLQDNNSVIRQLFDFIYPVGSYYETSDATFDPNVTWGGTWEPEIAGQVHVSSGTGYTLGATGGSPYIQAHTHDFTNPTINSASGGHTHTVTVRYRTGALASGSAQSQPYANAGNTSNNIAYTPSGGGTHGHTYSANGSVGAVSGATTGQGGNYPPYIVVNRWHRTA